MTAEEFQQLISFDAIREADGDTVIIARFSLQATRKITGYELQRMSSPEMGEQLTKIRADLVERLMRSVYEDQREFFIDALVALLCVPPMDGAALEAARQRLVDIAQRQPSASLTAALD